MRSSLTRTLAICFAALNCQSAIAQTAKEDPATFAARTKWWSEAKFGMFIHWGVYAVPADVTTKDGKKSAAEWFFYNKQYQVKDYEKFAPQFNPVQFDARKWVKTAKDAGMKYIVITSKHHDGFCMFDSKLTDYCITKATPFKRDPMKELAAECRRQGIRLCFYHSIMDWHHPDYVPRRPWEKETRPATGADLNRYIDYMKGQLAELLTNYGPIGVIWFDGGWEHNAQELHSAEVNAMIRKLQPGIIINDRNQLAEDHSTPEQTIPANALPGGRLWETCMTMNDTWGYGRNDTNWKSTEDLVHKLCDIASKGGNFLLNVGPTELGTFPDAIDERLAEVGKWMKVNGESIYGTTKSPWVRYPFEGRVTLKGNSIYLQVFKWPEGGVFQFSGVSPFPASARVLGTNERVLVVSLGGSLKYLPLAIHKPKKLDPYATVIELRFIAPPEIQIPPPPAQKAAADGSFTLRAKDAEIHGSTAQLEHEDGTGKGNIGFWFNAGDYLTWEVDSPGGRFHVTAEVACDQGNGGSEFTFGYNSGQRLSGTVPDTGSWTAYRTIEIGELSLATGRQHLSLMVKNKAHDAVMNLRNVRLIPVK